MFYTIVNCVCVCVCVCACVRHYYVIGVRRSNQLVVFPPRPGGDQRARAAPARRLGRAALRVRRGAEPGGDGGRPGHVLPARARQGPGPAPPPG